ncbi:MAG: trypsin-like peptidase domain-containing protein [Lentimicrobiaceae bacterium]|jgi:Do/DeqQ family serine protease|nr:trypsin-like peptidase domain-containing protein [Lentimicrobiaceae bacterium]
MKKKSLMFAFYGAIFMLLLVLIVVKINKNDAVKTETVSDQRVAVQQQMPIHRTTMIPADQNTNFVDAAEKTVNAVVHIRTEITRKTATYDNFFGMFREYLYGQSPQMQSRKQIGFGSGVVLSSDGYIVTNNHVVEGADDIEVTFNDKRKQKAVVIGTDPTTDLALIKVDCSDCDFLLFGNSDQVRIGEWVLAVGNPFNLTSTVTAGIVSAKARNINILGGNSSIESFIQTDAVINRGNSGGALVNTQGELIGINAAIASHTGTYEGYSFAIPSNTVRKVVDDLLEFGQPQRAYIGVIIREMTAELADEKGFDKIVGVYIESTSENGAAAESGIKSGDVITSVNGVSVNTIAQLQETIGQYRPGDKVDVAILRNNKPLTYRLELKNQDGNTEVNARAEMFFDEDLGIRLEVLSAHEQQKLNISGGLKVVEIREGLFKRGGINTGFIITKINGKKVDSKNSFESALNQKQQNRTRIEGMYPQGMKISFEFYD